MKVNASRTIARAVKTTCIEDRAGVWRPRKFPPLRQPPNDCDRKRQEKHKEADEQDHPLVPWYPGNAILHLVRMAESIAGFQTKAVKQG
jgi:hypothetical protein